MPSIRGVLTDIFYDLPVDAVTSTTRFLAKGALPVLRSCYGRAAFCKRDDLYGASYIQSVLKAAVKDEYPDIDIGDGLSVGVEKVRCAIGGEFREDYSFRVSYDPSKIGEVDHNQFESFLRRAVKDITYESSLYMGDDVLFSFLFKPSQSWFAKRNREKYPPASLSVSELLREPAAE